MTADAELQLGIPRALAALGDRSSLLVLRAIWDDHHTFSDIRADTGLSDGALGVRLAHLTEYGLLSRTPTDGSRRRWRYELTDAARGLWGFRVSLWRWGRMWSTTGATYDRLIVHTDCGKSIVPTFGCGACSAIGLTPQAVSTAISPTLGDELNHPASTRRVRIAALPEVDAIALVGDGWSMAVLGAALLGAHSFSDFKRMLGPVSTATLSERLTRFMRAGLLTQGDRHTSRRHPYRVTQKARSFFPIFVAIAGWSADLADDPGMRFWHIHCGEQLVARYTCNYCNGTLSATNTIFAPARPIPAVE